MAQVKMPPLPPGWIREEDPTVPEQIPGSGAPIVPPQGDPLTGQPVATPLSASYKDQIEQMVSQLANRSGKFATGGGEPAMAGSVMGETRDRLANVVAGYLKMFAPDPTDPTQMAVVVNPRQALARYTKKFYPKMYGELENSEVRHIFHVPGKSLELPFDAELRDVNAARGLKNHADSYLTGFSGANFQSRGSDHNLIGISPNAWDTVTHMLDDAIAETLISSPDPTIRRRANSAIKVVPHEVGHGVRQRTGVDLEGRATVTKEKGALKGKTRLYDSGMPLPKKMRFNQAAPDVPLVSQSSKVGNRLQHAIASGQPGNARLSPSTLDWIRGNLTHPGSTRGYTPEQLADEALIEEAATNQARMAARQRGLMDPKLLDELFRRQDEEAVNRSLSLADPSITQYLKEVYKR